MGSRLEGRTVVVTGASSGLGDAACRLLAAEGAAVIGLARRFPRGRAAGPAPGAIHRVALDVTVEDDVAARFAEAGVVNALVCAAGSGVWKPLVETTAAELRALLDVHVVGTFLCARAMLAARAAAPRPGLIVVVSSVAALRTFTASGAYSAAKEGQRGLARVLVDEARPYGVRVTALYPGAVNTPLWDPRPGFDRAAMMRPDDVAGLVVELVARPEVAVEELLVMPPGGAL